MRLQVVVVSICLLLLTFSAANASVIGDLKTTSGTALLTVTVNTITFGDDTTSIPAGGNAEVAGGTTLTFDGGPLPMGDAVFMQNLNFPPAFPIDNWMTFAGFPNLDYTLTGEGPGSTNTDCAALPNFGTCSPFLGDPVVLELLNGTTVASLSLNGTVTDGSGVTSIWNGSITADIVVPLPDGSAPTPGDIQNYFATNPNGSLSLGNAGDFNASAVTTPEPASLLMIGTGLIGLAAFLRRRSTTK